MKVTTCVVLLGDENSLVARQSDLVDTIVLLKPQSWSKLHLVILKQTFVKKLLNDFVIQIFSNED